MEEQSPNKSAEPVEQSHGNEPAETWSKESLQNTSPLPSDSIRNSVSEVPASNNTEPVPQANMFSQAATTSDTPAPPIAAIHESPFEGSLPKVKSKFPLGKILGLLVVIAIFSIIGVVAYGAYVADDIPLLNAKQEAQLARMVVKMPAVPKTDTMILTAAATSDADIKSMMFDGQMALSVEAEGESTDMVMNYSGAYDAKEGDPSLQFVMDIDDEEMPLAMEMRLVDNKMYMQVPNAVFGMFTGNMAPGSSWYGLSLDELTPVVPDTTAQDDSSTGLLNDDELDDFQKFIDDNDLSQYLERLENEKVGNFETYRFRFAPTEELWTKLINKAMEEAAKDDASSAALLQGLTYKLSGALDFYLDVKTLMFVKLDMNVDTSISMNTLPLDPMSITPSRVLGALSQNAKMNIKFVFTVKNVNEPVTISAPEGDIVPFEQIINTLFMGSFGEEGMENLPADYPTDFNMDDFDFDMPAIDYDLTN